MARLPDIPVDSYLGWAAQRLEDTARTVQDAFDFSANAGDAIDAMPGDWPYPGGVNPEDEARQLLEEQRRQDEEERRRVWEEERRRQEEADRMLQEQQAAAEAQRQADFARQTEEARSSLARTPVSSPPMDDASAFLSTADTMIADRFGPPTETDTFGSEPTSSDPPGGILGYGSVQDDRLETGGEVPPVYQEPVTAPQMSPSDQWLDAAGIDERQRAGGGTGTPDLTRAPGALQTGIERSLARADEPTLAEQARAALSGREAQDVADERPQDPINRGLRATNQVLWDAPKIAADVVTDVLTPNAKVTVGDETYGLGDIVTNVGAPGNILGGLGGVARAGKARPLAEAAEIAVRRGSEPVGDLLRTGGDAITTGASRVGDLLRDGTEAVGRAVSGESDVVSRSAVEAPSLRSAGSGFVGETANEADNALSQTPGGSGFVPRLGADAYNAAGGAALGGLTETTEAIQEGRDVDPGEMLRRGAAGAVGGLAAGRLAARTGLREAGSGFAARQGEDLGHSVATGSDPSRQYQFRYRVAELDDLVASHTPGGAPNPAFPRELQPRERGRAASQAQIDQIARSLEPSALLTDAGRLDSGPMIVGPDNIVESGNGRTLALARAAEQYPEQYQRYTDELRTRLPEYGLSAGDLQSMQHPVLVRERITDVDRAAFAADANNAGLLQMSSFEQAMQDARRLSDETIASLTVGENDTIGSALRRADNRDLVRSYAAAVPDNERAALLDARGDLSAQGFDRLASALLMRTYGGPAGERIARAFIESADPVLRNVERALMASLPDVARAEALIRSGARDAALSASDDVAGAVEMLARLRTNGIKVEDYLAQGDLWARETTPLQDELLGFFDRNVRTPNKIREALRGYASRVEAAADPNQVGMFGDVARPTGEEVWRGIIGRVDDPIALARSAEAGAADQAAGAGLAGARAASGALTEAPGGFGEDPLTDLARLRAENARLRGEPAPAPSPTTRSSGPISQPGMRRGRAPDGQPSAFIDDVGRRISATPAAEISRVRLDRFPPEVRDTIQEAAAGIDWARPGQRGVIPVEDAQRLAEMDRRAANQAITSGKMAKVYNEEESIAVRNAVAAQAGVVRDLSEEIAAARADKMMPDLLIAKHAVEAAKLDAVANVAEGSRPEAARAMRTYQQQKQLLDLDPDAAIARIYKQLGGHENAAKRVDEYNEMIRDGADAAKLRSFWNKTINGQPGFKDWFTLWRRNSMLSGPRTFEVNLASGAGELAYATVGDAAESLLHGNLRAARSKVAAPILAFNRGRQAFIQTIADGISPEQAARGDLPRDMASRIENPVGRTVASILEAPDRFNAATDAWIRTMAHSLGIANEATRIATKEGLIGKAWASRVADLQLDPSPTMLEVAGKTADRITFQGEMGDIGRGIAKLKEKSPVLGNILVPFMTTVYHIGVRSIDRSPLGLVSTAGEAAKGTYKAGKALPEGVPTLEQRQRDNFVGSMVFAYAYDQATRGNVTGSGPDDPEKRQMLRATGWRPYSVKVGDEYWSYSNFGPVALPLSMAAAAHEAQAYKKDDATAASTALDGVKRTAAMVSDMSILSGIGAIVKAQQDPERYGTQWLTQFAQTFIPYGSALNTVGQAMDPIERRPARDDTQTQIGQSLLARIPPNPFTPDRTDVPAALDPLGREIENQQQGLRALHPSRPSRERDDPILKAYLDAGVDIGGPPKEVTLSGVKIDLAPEQQRAFSRYMGQSIIREFPKVSQMPARERPAALKMLYDRSRDVARGRVLEDIGPAELNRRAKASAAGTRR